MADKCKRCGACKECGSPPQPYPVYPAWYYPHYIPMPQPVYPYPIKVTYNTSCSGQ